MNHNNNIENVANLKKKLEKGVSYDKTLHILHKLQKIPISIELLQQTGIGKTVRHLSKVYDNEIGKTAKHLRLTWKAIVKEEQEQQESYDNDITDACTSWQSRDSIRTNDSKEKLKIKSEYIDDKYNDDPLSLDNKIVKKQKYNDECEQSSGDDKKPINKKHKSSSKAKDKSCNKFEDFLGLSDEIIRNNKKISPNKKSEPSSAKNKTHVNDSLFKELIPIKHIKQEFTKSLTSDSKSIEKDILTSLASSNYKSFSNREQIDERAEANKRKTLDDLSMRVQSRKGRTAVFAGNARTNCTHVLKLEEICLNVLMDNIEKIYSVGDAPYYLIKPVLRKCNPKQLARIEKFNPQLIVDEETDELWKEICNKEFKDRELDTDEVDTWRDFYFHLVEDREHRLKKITANIKRKEAKAVPVRQTQLAFGNNAPKPPREVLRKQEKAAANNGRFLNGYNASSSHHNGSVSVNSVKIVPEKPKVGPLMKKALKMQKARFRR